MMDTSTLVSMHETDSLRMVADSPRFCGKVFETLRYGMG